MDLFKLYSDTEIDDLIEKLQGLAKKSFNLFTMYISICEDAKEEREKRRRNHSGI